MKKNLFYVIVVIVSMIFISTSCGSKSGEGLSEDEKKELVESLNYKKACELKDFSTAYEIVDKLKEVTSEKKKVYESVSNFNHIFKAEYQAAKDKSDEAERYVVLQESLIVIESEGSNGLMRIVAIAKEHNAENWLFSELLDVAKKIGDTDLAERIQNMINPDSKVDSSNEE